MKRIAKHINRYCTFCRTPEHKVKALWRMSFTLDNVACEDCKDKLAEVEKKQRTIDERYSEADYQTWMRL